ncbi:hydrogenase maturation nickel metallochaperone HypA [bacterium]|nr:hydrogenase maturation nickel metallochaperone HypA [bacterium]
MHEFFLTEGLIRLATDEATKAGIVILEKITVQIGALSGVNIDSIDFAFGILSKNNELTRDTELVVEEIPGRGKCSRCGREIELERLYLICPNCNSPTVEITGGREFIIKNLVGEGVSDG